MAEYTVKCVLDIKAELGECPMWSAGDQSLYWIDIERKTINRFHPASGDNKAWQLPAKPGCFAFRDGNGAVVAANDGIYDFDFGTGLAKKLAAAPFDSTLLRFNDGRTDRQGRLWAGTVPADMRHLDTKGAFYRFDGKSLDQGIAPIRIANGTAFSPDGRTMYRAESMLHCIFAYDYDPETGTPSRERIFAKVPEDFGHPDGATVDTQGGYWIALPNMGGHGHIARFTPDGRLDFRIEVPVMVSTMAAFGGPDLSTLYITSARLEEYVKGPIAETAGAIFAVETKFRGEPETRFRPRA
jgi:sugar lactone lactonase YvrE